MLFLFFAPALLTAVNKKVGEKSWEGVASYYHNKFNGRLTANGEIFSNKKLTAANNFLPLGTWVRVTNLSNRKSVVVKINDRMNKRNKRLIDMSHESAKRLGYIHDGLAKVRIEVIPRPKK